MTAERASVMAGECKWTFRVGILTILLGVFGLGGCSAVALHPDARSAVAASRLADGLEVRKSQRWVLPPLSEITLHAPQSRHATQYAAASRGLARSLRVRERAPWRVLVHWPEWPRQQAAEDGRRLAVELLPWHRLVPLPAERAVLVVDVLDASGEHWVQRLEVDVRAWWFGPDWHDEQALERAFAEVGRVLVGA